MKKTVILSLTVMLSTMPLLAMSKTDEASSQKKTKENTQVASPELYAGVVKGKNVVNKTLMLQHGPLANLSMPGMTMAYKVGDEKMLSIVEKGDNIAFHVEKQNDGYVITRLEKK